jgi:hypothetical protein
MREERGTLRGDQRIFEPFNLWGSIGGNVNVIQGGKFYVRGAIYGNLTVEYGGRVHIFGNVSGNLRVERGAKVIHSGVVGGSATNDGGRLYIEHMAKVMGDVVTLRGETKDDRPQAQPEE